MGHGMSSIDSVVEQTIRRSRARQALQEGESEVRAPFVGIGPGRCGTFSLHMILNACQRVRCTHEVYPSHWYSRGRKFDELYMALDSSRSGPDIVGEVQCTLIPHVEALRRLIPELKVICLHRDKQPCVKSHLKFLPFLRPFDKQRYKGNVEFTHRFPIIDAATSIQATEFYWEMCEEAMAQVEPPVLHLKTEDLNDDIKLSGLYDFLAIPNGDRVYPQARHHNHYLTTPDPALAGLATQDIKLGDNLGS